MDAAVSATRLRVLLVEDNDGDAALAQVALSGGRFTVTRESTLASGISRAQTHPFDVVLLDSTLPDSSGLDTLVAARRALPQATLVAFTGHDADDNALARVASLADDYVAKDQAMGPLLPRTLRYVSERAAHLRAIARMSDDLERLLSRSPVGSVVVDEADRVLFINQRAAMLLEGSGRGRRRGDTLGLGLTAGSTQLTVLGETPRLIDAYATETLWRGHAAALITLIDAGGVESDQLTARIAHADRLTSIGQLAAGVAHEVNNPSAAIAANLAVLASHVSDRPESLELISESLDAIESIRDIVIELTTFVRERDRQIEAVDLREVVQQAMALVRHQIRHVVEVREEIEEPCSARANRTGMVQILTNLLLNSAHALPGRADRDPSIFLIRVFPKDDRVILEVSDNGAGIDAGALDRIFQPFFTTKPPGEGTGLGLPMVRRLVRSYGGFIDASSDPGVLTTFRIALHRAEPDKPDASTQPTSKAQPIEATQEVRIWVVDDDRSVRLAVERLLVFLGYRPRMFSAGPDVIAALETGEAPPEVMLLDLMMPKMNGMELFHRLQSSWPALAPRIAFFSGGAVHDDVEAFLNEVKPPVLAKPATPDEIKAVVERLASAGPPTS